VSIVRGETILVRSGAGVLYCEAVEERECAGENCGEVILWVRTPKGALMPIDLPIPDDAPATSHFASCVDAESFRR